MSVEAGQVYADLGGSTPGRLMRVESICGGMPDAGDTLYAVITALDGHPSRTGVVAHSRLTGQGYRLVETPQGGAA